MKNLYSKYNSDFYEPFRLMVRRRGANNLKSVESEAFGSRLVFGLADNTAILPAVASTFYYIADFYYQVAATLVTAPPTLELTKLGVGSVGVAGINFWPFAVGGPFFLGGIETDSMIYRVNGNTAGTIFIGGTVYKITYA